jgi:gamma-glutamylcyclotransferase (GGCT)/AIG2-like uncharacterized protein YtfP
VSAPAPTTVFVYGTLMPGERNAHVARQGGPFTAQPATLPGHRLLHLHPEGYPAVIPGAPADTVRGMALTYAPHAWAAALVFLDALEGVRDTPPLYTRDRVTLHTGAGLLPAWVYVYARADRLARPGATPVPGGDWLAVPDRARPPHGDR